MQAINALVASLDHLPSFPNVLLLATNNLTSSMNVAFLDRADHKVSVGLPILEARYEILKETLMELLHVGIVQDHYVFCNFHNVSTQSMSKTASVSPF
jgi:SpoVK/Ycf46/Vps4 family AAA+-type ATPase